ncbi:hypothetical protein IGI04_017498 [Brassica rapa subsp. trilocularis]|uniref:HMG box domain-containing protein n=1 Tax=Brassica rapa subsp. trilocularis TaxID=1813537 RepID=A0ABQ7MDN3_BRACM|nr:hypothetical protein IGI04_017498 [Brassica rapa subsp. trilocularis]
MELAVVVVVTEATQIQHVNRKSSDELLRKFADPDDLDEPTKSTKRPRKSASRSSRENGVDVESNTSTTGLVERKRLLLAPAASKRRSMFLRQIASGKSHLKNKSLVRTIGKTWRKTMEGASRVFIEKHYNRHRRLINDVL